MLDFTLRSFLISDAETFAKHANNRNISNMLTDAFPHPYSKKHAIFFINTIVADPLNFIQVIEVNGEACGAIGCHGQHDVYRKNAEMGYWLSEDYWGNGIVTRAVGEMVRKSFQQRDYNRIFARPYGCNTASQRILEKNNFILEGILKNTFYKNEKYEDEYIYAIRRNTEE